MMVLALTQLHRLIYETEVYVLLLKVSIYMPSLKVVKNVIERMKNLSSFLVSLVNQFTLGVFIIVIVMIVKIIITIIIIIVIINFLDPCVRDKLCEE